MQKLSCTQLGGGKGRLKFLVSGYRFMSGYFLDFVVGVSIMNSWDKVVGEVK